MKILMTEEFLESRNEIKDPRIKTAVTQRLIRLEDGNFGDHKPLTNAKGIWELRIDKGAAYRIYYMLRGKEIVILLCSGEKKTQTKDIAKAIKISQEV